MGETLLPKRIALAVFCSDPISSVAYATEQIVLVLAAGGVAALRATPWVGLVVVLLLVTVVASYRQTCVAYPSGGGAYVVSRDNLGESASLAAAAALLVDYVMTVAVSVTSGVVAVTSAIPALSRHAVGLSVGLIVVLMVANLRGTKESGRVFAVPTYAFVGLTLLMFVWAGVRAVTTGLPQAVTATLPVEPRTAFTGLAMGVLLVRAFASGCTALTGVEAISNGVPSFEKPKARNAATTLTLMGVIAVVLFGGITVLAVALNARALPDGDPSVISQIAAAVFGRQSPLFYLFQAATMAILVLAANTAFNGFPVLASILARDGYLPRQLHNRGDRLVFSNGVVLLAAAAVALIVGFDANLDRLIQLYIVGVFTSFTLSQSGMVRHWQKVLGDRDAAGGPSPVLRPRRIAAGVAASRAAGPGDQRHRGGVHRGGVGRRVRDQGHPGQRLEQRHHQGVAHDDRNPPVRSGQPRTRRHQASLGHQYPQFGCAIRGVRRRTLGRGWISAPPARPRDPLRPHQGCGQERPQPQPPGPPWGR